ncbi:MAG: 50S ribosomal protein L1 [Bacilli bacterium]|jgi:large subunit ribosomal protein L1
MKKQGKKYKEILKRIEKDKLYSKEEAIKLVKETNICNFDATVELVVCLNIDTKKADQQLKGAMVLPHGTGKIKKVLVLAKGESANQAKEVGADFVGDEDYIEKISKEKWLGFDILIATPEMMSSLGKIGKILGPKGLMPNPKTGTVTTEIKKAVLDVKKGRIEYKTDSYGNIHTVLGKCSFNEEQLLENLDYIINNIMKSRPSTVKGNFIEKVSISTTMGPGIKIDKNSFDK